MSVKKVLSSSLFLCLIVGVIPSGSFAATKLITGKNCKTLGQKTKHQSQTFTCTKSGTKLVWVKVNTKAIPAAAKEPRPTATKKSNPIQVLTDGLSYKNPMIYDVKGGQLIRKADSGEYFESDSRTQSKFNPIRVRAFQELNTPNIDRSHPNINFIYSISPSFPSFLIEFSKRELDEAASLWNSYFDRKIDVNVYFVTEKDRESIKSNSWLQRNLPSVFTRFEGRQERPFIAGGGGYWKGDKDWNGNIFLATASYLDHSYINYEWPAIAKHEFVHLVQDYAFARDGRMRNAQSEFEAVQPQNFREGAANTIAYLTAFRNLGWSNDALDWVAWSRASSVSKWKSVASLQEVREMLVATDVGTPDEAFQASYGVGALMYEWVLGTYGLTGFKKLMDNFAIATNFDQSVQAAFGISKDTFYDRASIYVYQEYSRVFS